MITSRGISLASICCLYNSASDTISHLFFQCNFARNLWKWLSIKEGFHLLIALLMTGAVLATMSSGNSLKHDNLKPSCMNSTIHIMSQTKMVRNNDVNHSSISISYFVLIKAFGVKIPPPRAPNIKEVIWSPPSRGWFKCNCDGAYSPDTNDSGCGDIFRNNYGDFLLAFA
ncbi:hypothetical protein KIW84_030724 [Lathyrus oleraceus]|uniref:Reverse transcriptase zinc-binding domain-containing protein n=1 Tax=Pisum sativum TaxID=3888 RepID=A0A9D5AUB9_PEA|nr:hypothetical protein KIW84_030724 [Pisum sativum]